MMAKLVIVILAVLYGGLSMADARATVSVDPDSMRYQMCIDGAAVKYDAWVMKSPAEGIAPASVKGYVLDGRGRSITGPKGYASFGLYSGSQFLTDFQPLPAEGRVCSDWLPIGALLGALEQDSGGPIAQWAEVRVSVSFTLLSDKGESSVAVASSEWVKITPSRRVLLMPRVPLR